MLPFDSPTHVYVPGLGCALATLDKKLTSLTFFYNSCQRTFETVIRTNNTALISNFLYQIHFTTKQQWILLI